MIRAVFFLACAIFLGMGVYMLAMPETFYAATPGVLQTGPYNSHFIRDVGFAFLVSGGALGWGAATGLRPLIIVGAAWPAAHGLFHLQIWVAGGCALDAIGLFDLGVVILPPLTILGLAFFAAPRSAAAAI